MNAYLLPLSCPRDGQPLEHVTGSLAAGTETSAICRCDQCGNGYQVIVHLRPVANPANRRAARRRTAVSTGTGSSNPQADGSTVTTCTDVIRTQSGGR